VRLLHVVLACVAPLTASCHGDAKKGSAESQALESDPESPDARLEREVRAKLFGDPQLSGGGSIAIIVDGRRVILEGWVSSVNERTLAEADAATVAGVVTVDNRLVVRGVGTGSQ
jgi:osmotically-inducible protein OsmY